MHSKKLIAALAALIIIPVAAVSFGERIDFAAPDKIFFNNPIFDANEQASIVSAQNDKNTTEDSEKTESEAVTGESEAAAEGDKKSSEAESKPLKPFVPSEQIAGEQAVDFPADI